MGKTGEGGNDGTGVRIGVATSRSEVVSESRRRVHTRRGASLSPTTSRRTMRPSLTSRTFDRPTSVFISGGNRSLLNWVALAFAAESNPEFVWTDVRLHGESLAASDPLAQGRVPDARLSVVFAEELVRNDEAAKIALGGVVRADEPPENVMRLVDFLRLPTHTQRQISKLPKEGPPMVFVLSNSHRMAALYPPGTVRPVVRAIVAAGVILIQTFADASPEGRFDYDTVLHIEGDDNGSWKTATIRVEQAPPSSRLTAGSVQRLSDFPPISTVLDGIPA